MVDAATETPTETADTEPRRRRRRWLRWTLIALAGLVVLFYVGGGWYFSTQLGNDAFVVDHSGDDPFEIEITAIDASTVTLEVAAGDEPTLDSPGVFGLEHAEGRLQLGRVVSSTSDGTTDAAEQGHDLALRFKGATTSANIDHVMVRTKKRPLPSGRMSPAQVLLFGLALSVLSFVVLWWSANLLTALLAIFGIFFYVVIYSQLLKRNSTQNIVIGGAAGAIPPLVGWAAVANEISLLPIFLFMIVFYWTPPHFWALALMRQKEYAAAGVPMLPVVAGDRETHKQILLYTVLMLTMSLAPVFLAELEPDLAAP